MRPKAAASTLLPGCFNPRTRKGCDGSQWDMNKHFLVSTHAPVKDATDCFTNTGALIGGFNPRTRKGCDLPLQLHWLIQYSFNPRTRKGCDCMFVESFIDNIFSI